ncbi:MAG: alkaline phosphatase, partial [Planctomycetota bacterium]
RTRSNFSLTTVAVLALATSPVAAQEAKNVILMISDGAGDTTWQAANQFQFGTSNGPGQRYEQADFAQHWMTTYSGHTQPLAPSTDLGFGPIGLLPSLYNEIDNFPGFGSYDPAAANNMAAGPVRTLGTPGELGRGTSIPLTPDPSLPPQLQAVAAGFAGAFDVTEINGFAAYDYLTNQSITDSAAAGTALATGQKTYNSAINVDLNENPVEFITQTMVNAGKRAGVVSTKAFTDATPAAFGTQNNSRQNEAAISDSMIRNGLLDVVISPGHPEFGSGGVRRDTPDYDTVSEANLAALRSGVDGWNFVDDTDQLTAIGNGTAAAPDRLFGLVPVSSQLHSRDTSGRTNAYDPRLFDPADPNGAVPFVMPDLDVLSRAAIKTLEQDEDGFFLMIENGSVDSAAHANDLPRMVEEQLSFNRAVDEVIAWVETESSWDETLLIITTDHANGLFLGPDSDSVYFQDPIAQGEGELPDGIWWSTEHTNELVPLWTRGVGSDLFGGLTDGVDPRRGAYIDNTDVHTVMAAVVPEPTSLSLLAVGGLLLRRRRGS